MSPDSSAYRKCCTIDLNCSPSGREQQKLIGGRKNWPVNIKPEFTQCYVLCAVKKGCLKKRVLSQGVARISVNTALSNNIKRQLSSTLSFL